MKNLNFKATLISFVVAFAFTACNCGTGDTTATDAVEEVAACADDCQKACCLGCKATEGEAKCIVAEDGSMPCCVTVETAEEVVEESDEGHDHEGHDHEGHDHE